VEIDHPVIQWLLDCPEPAVHAIVLSELVGLAEDDPRLKAARLHWLEGPWVRGLLAGQAEGGGFGVQAYQKWTGAHWRLVSLVELGAPPGEPHACAAADTVLAWLTGDAHRQRIHVINGRTRRCASQEGNALAACCRLGLVGDPRVKCLAESLVAWQWPDGGWNCDKNPDAWHSSFYETLSPLWGLIEYQRLAAWRAVEFFLRHRLFRSETTGKVINPEWLRLHYPPYWHYDILQALLVLSRLTPLTDERMQEALEILASLQRPDGCWRAGSYYWYLPGTKPSNVEVIHWGRGGPNVMITLNALRVLKAAGRIS
jgi:hypothetical protein